MDIINPYIHGGEAAPAAFDGFGNRSRSFNGVDDYISIADNADIPTGAQTICCWVKFNTLNSGASGQDLITHWTTVDSNNASFAIYMPNASNGKVRFYVSADGQLHVNVEALDAISALEWSHVACVFTPNDSIKIYINGSLSNTLATTGISSLYNSSVDLVLGGRDQVSVTTLLNGNLADCRIYDSALSGTDISDIYNGTNITTNLVGHWLTDADNLLDAAGSNNGTNYGSKYSYDNPSPPVEFGRASRSFDGSSHRIEIADNSDHNFGDGVNDSPFSASAWIKIEATSKAFRILCKWSDPVGPEWAFSTDSSDRLSLFLKDVSANALIKRYYSVNMSAYLDQWVHVAATYDGRGGVNAADGIELYLNSVQVDDTNGNSGNYTAMENTTSPTYIGAVEIQSGYSTAQGKIADVRLYDTDLTATEISDLYAGTDVQANLVGHWLTDNDDVEDKAGTNDGTNFGSTYSYDNPPMDLVPSRQASRDFSGVSQHIEMSDVVSIGTGSLSWSCWLNADSTVNTRGIVRMGRSSSIGNARYDGLQILLVTSKISGYLIDYNNSGNVFPIQSSSNAVVGKWHHAVVSLDANAKTLELFVDGVSEGSVSLSSIHPWDITAQDPPSIGAREIADGNFTADEFNGRIADVRLYDSALTSTEVLAIYNGTTDRTNLIGQWLTNSDDVIDHAGTNDGTNNNSTYSTDSPS